MKDDFKGRADPTMGARAHMPITPDNDTDLPVRPLAIYVLTDGNLVLRAPNLDTGEDQDITYPVLAGQVLDLQPTRVLETSTATAVAWGWRA